MSREYKRHAMRLPGQFSIDGGRPCACIIRDFYDGGMLITFVEAKAVACGININGVNRQSNVDISFRLGGKHHSVRANLAQVVSSTSIGVEFTSTDEALLIELQQLAGHQLDDGIAEDEDEEVISSFRKSNSSGIKQVEISADKRQAIFKSLCHAQVEFTEEQFPHFFKECKSALQREVEKGFEGAEQRALHDALAIFNAKIEHVYKGLLSGLKQNFELALVNKPLIDDMQKAKSAEDLSLVGISVFEEWLAVKVLISNADDWYRRELLELQLRMDCLSLSRKKRQVNPLRPGVLCTLLHEQIRRYSLTTNALKIIYEVFGNTVLGNLDAFYINVNQFLNKEGILSDVNIMQYLTEKAVGNSTTGSSRRGANKPGLGALGEAKELANSALDALDAAAGFGYLEDPGTDADAARQAREYVPLPPSKRTMSSSIIETERALARRAADVAQKLIKVQNHLAMESTDYSSGHQRYQPKGKQRQNENIFSRREVLQGLSILQKRQKGQKGGVDRFNLSELLLKVMTELSGQDKVLPEDEANAIDVIEKLFGVMLEHTTLASSASSLAPYVMMLKIPLAKVNILDPNLLGAELHPAREVLNQIAQLGMRGGAIKKDTLTEVDRIVIYILDNFDQNIAIFEEMLPSLHDLLMTQDEVYNRNRVRVQETYDGQESIDLSKNAVEEAVQDSLSYLCAERNGKIPKIIADMLAAGWRELLVLAYIRQGVESAPWKMGLNVLVSVYLKLAKQTPAEGVSTLSEKELLKVTAKGFAKATSNTQKYIKVLERLKLFMAGMVPASEITWIPLVDLQKGADAESVIKKLKSGRPRIAGAVKGKWLERTEHMMVNDWVAFQAKGNREQRTQLAWMSKEREIFVFVNQQGMKAFEKSRDELAYDLQTGQAYIMSGIFVSIVDQSLDLMVEKIYTQVTYDASHDQLTGLYIRKEFERRLERVLLDAKQNCSKHTLCHIDLDQFKVINSNCGYEAGDKVLADIAGILINNIPEGGIVARLAGNVFGVLIENCYEGEAYRLASSLVSSIQEYKYVWKNTPYRLNASVGLLTIDEDANDVESLLESVESACVGAKESGRNRINTYRPDDDEMRRRKDIMAWVAKLNRALDEDKLVLRVQPITELEPWDESDGWIKKKDSDGLGVIGHCEILLSVLDDSGDIIPPLEFIRAAERYNRMQSVDRWVIRKVFNWVAENPKTMEYFGGVSINLSGHSVNDEELMRFIFEEFKTSGVDPTLICFEITETVAVANINDAADFVNEMKRLGCKFSLDDFGAGLSSYTYLKHLPVDYIKIDGAFVKNIASDDVDFAMVRSITEMGHLMGKKVIAEYVAGPEAIDRLRSIGVNYGQGYYIGEPKLMSEYSDHQLAIQQSDDDSDDDGMASSA